MFQIRRKLELLSVLFFFQFAFLNLGSYVFHDSLGICAHVPQDIDKQTVLIAQRFKDVCSLNRFASLRARSLHCPLEQIRSVGSNSNSFSNVLLASAAKTLFDRHLDHYRIKRQFAHRRVEHIRLFYGQSLEYVLDCHEVLVPPA